MDAVRRANFASKQVRAGPAPLASFEDLPSDELESPEDFVQLPLHTSSAIDDLSSNQDLQFATPDSLTISSQSTPRIECDFGSHFTITPGTESYDGHSTTELRTTSLSSLSKEVTSLNASQKKGTAQSLGNLDSSSSQLVPETNTRKSSWTDMFRSHTPNSAKPSTDPTSAVSEPVEEKHPKKKKSRSKKEESKSKEKGKFLSFLKKKSNKTVSSPLSPGEHLAPSENVSISDCTQNLPEEVISPKVTNGSVSKGKENELPTNIELSPMILEAQNDLGKTNSERNDKIPDERKISRKLINISEKPVEKECNVFAPQENLLDNLTSRHESQDKQFDHLMSRHENQENQLNNPLSRQETQDNKLEKASENNIQAVVEECERESSESEITLEAKTDTITEDDATLNEDETETDFEAETLISQDMSELDEDSLIEIRPLVSENVKQLVIPSRQQRLEVTTKPIDRPRSTTPINVAPLEAFIQSVSPTFVSKIEKIKLSLPGEQFVNRIKSPKKSSARSWTDFCESVLHSPRMHKRTGSEDQADPFGDGAPFNSEFDSNWAAFESNFESSGSNSFVETFAMSVSSTNQADQSPTKLSDPYAPFTADFAVLSCVCSCHAYGCRPCEQTKPNSEVKTGPCGCVLKLPMVFTLITKTYR
ncbi:hypothetical protein JTE90_027929 [Oedothorax gibbosus]|uniref:Uncharacterized protein n=1 Tax=Oedothorax gibbosus TaxID=931172 RepID=A0AAV6VGU8_9ARAC|nr:hypothetical protein JTE90_027929 [Oedothorax gibbosus]